LRTSFNVIDCFERREAKVSGGRQLAFNAAVAWPLKRGVRLMAVPMNHHNFEGVYNMASYIEDALISNEGTKPSACADSPNHAINTVNFLFIRG
jgi:hypothetical protein